MIAKSLALFSSIVLTMVIYPAVTYWLAHWLVGHFLLPDWVTYLGLGVGVVIAFYRLYEISKKLNDENEKAE